MPTRLFSCFSVSIAVVALACSSDDANEGTPQPLDTDAAAGGSGGSGGSGGTTSGDDAGPVTGGGVDQFLSELGDAGWFDYLGRFTPSSEETAGIVTKHWFDVTPDGPQCIDSSQYGISTRDQGSDNLVIYLMGGGACWTNFPLCSNSVGTQINHFDGGGGLAFMNPTNTAFPTATWNHAFFPYCDGSVFAGDREADLFGTDTTMWGAAFGEGTEVLHGLQNLSAGLDVVKAQFPTANRILLSGSSAGGFGTLWATGLVRKLYPDAELLVFNDAGLGVLKEDDPSFREFTQSEFGAEDRYPASCSECLTSPHLVPVVSWGLGLDPNLKTAAFSATADGVVAGTFLGYGMDKSIWTAALLEETGAVHTEFPDQFKRFFIEGEQHTVLGPAWGTTVKNGVSIETWLAAMVDGDESVWTDMP